MRPFLFLFREMFDMEMTMAKTQIKKNSQKSGWTLSMLLHFVALCFFWVTVPRVTDSPSPTIDFITLGQGGTHFREKKSTSRSQNLETPPSSTDIPLAEVKSSPQETKATSAPTVPDSAATGRETSESGGASTGSTKGKASSAMDSYIQYVETTLQRFREYPALAKRLNQTGDVTVQFKIKKSGEIFDIVLLGPSPYKILNDSTLNIFKRIGRFETMPDEFNGEYKLVTQEFQYRLN